MTSTTVTRTLGKFVWRELRTRDTAAAKRFYTGLFGWTFEDQPMEPDWSYTLWKQGDRQIGGMMDLNHMPNGGEGVPTSWAVFVSVEDVDRIAEKAAAAGGTILSPGTDIPGVGRFAVIQDPQGAVLNLLWRTAGDPEDERPENGDFCWEMLCTADAAKAVDFYTRVIGWGSETDNDSPVFTRKAGGEDAYTANVAVPHPGTPSHWGTFVGVESLAASNAKARELGGEVIAERIDVPGYGAMAVIKDPTGAVIHLFESGVK